MQKKIDLSTIPDISEAEQALCEGMGIKRPSIFDYHDKIQDDILQQFSSIRDLLNRVSEEILSDEEKLQAIAEAKVVSYKLQNMNDHCNFLAKEVLHKSECFCLETEEEINKYVFRTKLFLGGFALFAIVCLGFVWFLMFG